ncbi:hypothetical protein, conserved [Babesia bigemina]|uniref:Uncharacterized protein n=1 Tax=Babesia bigemina TaxID=5866 RepID=A0A061BKA8_BABBI|nr:hypothetical protein, conserved [Babesia bigemina]CDR71877.1 hypothetical protein, conserved [Babesia bigemina]|eukprot:XP_012770820.1 hypothetical protein, conserved [Babesia bigemina]
MVMVMVVMVLTSCLKL